MTSKLKELEDRLKRLEDGLKRLEGRVDSPRVYRYHDAIQRRVEALEQK